jgi:hypothetical protein
MTLYNFMVDCVAIPYAWFLTILVGAFFIECFVGVILLMADLASWRKDYDGEYYRKQYLTRVP